MEMLDLRQKHPCPERKDYLRRIPKMILYHGTNSLTLHSFSKTKGRLLSIPRLILEEIYPIGGQGDCLDAISTTSVYHVANDYAISSANSTINFHIKLLEEEVKGVEEQVIPTIKNLIVKEKIERYILFQKAKINWFNSLSKEERKSLMKMINEAFPLVLGFDSYTVGDYIPIYSDCSSGEIGIYAQIDLKKARLKHISAPKENLVETVKELSKFTNTKQVKTSQLIV